MVYTVKPGGVHAILMEEAENEIRQNLQAGAVDAYIDGDTALEYLGDILKIHQMKCRPDESTADWVARIDAELDLRIQKIIDKTVEENVEHVAQENAR